MKQEIINLINEALTALNIEEVDFVVEHPEDLKNGDYSTNVALVLSKKLKMNPMELAEKIAESVRGTLTLYPQVLGVRVPLTLSALKIETAGAGFINFYLSNDFFQNSIKEISQQNDPGENAGKNLKNLFGRNKTLADKKIMVEYTQPNPFKPFHIGHLMSNAIGESISRLVEFSGAKTVRANYQGDVGLHVGKAIYGLLQKGQPDASTPVSAQAEYIGACYSFASNLYDTDEEIKKEIDVINKKVYEKSDSEINALYDWGRKITLEAFEEIYKILDTRFDHYFFESEMAPIGLEIVKKNVGKVFEESEGATVFKAEKFDPKLHTRVFVTKTGLPTYETKELGLTLTKFEKENPDISITETAIEQGEYMKVVRKAIEQINPAHAARMKHITHGMMRLASGKMSSRKGNVVTGESLLRDAMHAISEKIKDRDFSEEEKKETAESVGVAALKYSILKQAIGGDIAYDFEKSISFEGDSGPYLQYSYARARSIVRKAEEEKVKGPPYTLSEEISEPERLLYRFPEIVERAAAEFEPHYVATYLIDLARAFNAYYGNTKIVDKDDPTSPYRVTLTEAFSVVLKNGLWLLGIKAPEKM